MTGYWPGPGVTVTQPGSATTLWTWTVDVSPSWRLRATIVMPMRGGVGVSTKSDLTCKQNKHNLRVLSLAPGQGGCDANIL